MNYTKYNTTILCKETYRPNKRCRKEKFRTVKVPVQVKVRTLSECEFPVAFKVTDYASMYNVGRENYSRSKWFTEDIRYYKGKFYKPVRHTCGAAISKDFFNPEEKIVGVVKDTAEWKNRTSVRDWSDWSEEHYGPNAVITGLNDGDTIDEINKRLRDFVVMNGVVWESCGEPVYYYTTFGLGNNHGGTAMFLTFINGDVFDKRYYYLANDRKLAIEDALDCAKSRRDTHDYGRIRNAKENIEVLLPEFVGRIAKKTKRNRK